MTQPASAERMERVYERLSGTYDLIFDKVLQPGREEALRELALQPGERVLEIGVGTGLVLPMYPRDVEVTGIDLSDAMLAEAHERIVRHGLRHVSVLRMDAAALDFPDGSFDAVFAPYVISVVPDPARVMSEMARVCRPGGRIVVVNHFHSSNPVKAAVEKLFSPLSFYLGFHLDTPVSSVMDRPGLRLAARRRVNLLGNWTLLKFEKA
jgi:phosphatidylethanolamine/phosphatidyl-N-methylethanolamine N-methyltransferase